MVHIRLNSKSKGFFKNVTPRDIHNFLRKKKDQFMFLFISSTYKTLKDERL